MSATRTQQKKVELFVKFKLKFAYLEKGGIEGVFMDEVTPLLVDGHPSIEGVLSQGVNQGGFVAVDLSELSSGVDRGQSKERVEQQKEMSAAEAIFKGVVLGDEEARTYIEQKIARVNLAVESVFFFGAVVVVVVEGVTGSLDLSAMGWVADVVVIYTSGVGAYYARQTDKLVGFSYQVDRLRGQITRFQEAVDVEIGRFKKENDRLSGENDRYTKLLDQHAVMQAEMDSLVTAMTAKYDDLADVGVGLEGAADEIQAAVEGMAVLRKSMGALFPKLNTMLDGLQAQVAELSGQVDELTGQVDELTGEVDRLGGQIGELTTQVDELEATRAGLEKSVAMLATLGVEADKQGAFDAKVNAEAKRLQAEEKALLAKQQELQDQRELLQQEQQELLQREGVLVGRLEEQTAKLSKLDRLEGIVSQAGFRNIQMNSKIKELERQRDAAKLAATTRTALLLKEREEVQERLRAAQVVRLADAEEVGVVAVGFAVLGGGSSSVQTVV